MVRLAIGETRDVVLIEGTAQHLTPEELSAHDGDAFAEKTGFDPRKLVDQLYFRVSPRRLQAWREADEIKGRDLIVEGRWTVD
jgi:hypothetical protein